MKRGRPRGSALLLSLLLIAALFLLGLGFLGQHTQARLASRRTVLSAQSRELARAGLESCWTRLNHDLKFPPLTQAPERLYTYSEALLDVDDTPLGHYEVTIDASLAAPPYEILRVRSLGFIGNQEHPEAYHLISAELDLAPFDRSSPSQPNPQLHQWLDYWDQGGP